MHNCSRVNIGSFDIPAGDNERSDRLDVMSYNAQSSLNINSTSNACCSLLYQNSVISCENLYHDYSVMREMLTHVIEMNSCQHFVSTWSTSG